VNSRKTIRALTGVEVVAAIAVIGAVLYFVAPTLLPGASRRAEQSRKTTEQVIDAKNDVAAAQTASASVIGRAMQDVPDSPASSFVRNEIPIMLARGPAPDVAELINAEKRRVAFMEGKLDEQRRLTELALRDVKALTARVEKAEADKRHVDQALAEAAASERARTFQALGAGFVALLVCAAYVWLRFNSVSLPSIGRLAADIRQGVNPLQALNTVIDAKHHEKIQAIARQHMPLPDRSVAVPPTT
jgi:hypothetical protein